MPVYNFKGTHASHGKTSHIYLLFLNRIITHYSLYQLLQHVHCPGSFSFLPEIINTPAVSLAYIYITPVTIFRTLRKNNNGRIFFSYILPEKQFSTIYQLFLII